MEERKKILVLASWYPSRVKPFLGTFVQRQAEAAAKYANMAALFVISDPDMKTEYEVESKIINEVFTVNVYYKQAAHPFRKYRKLFKAYKAGWNHVLKHFGKPDLIHLNILWPAGLFVYYLKKVLGYKYIITENWTGYLESDGAFQRSGLLKRTFTRIIGQNAEMITPVSEDLKNAMIENGLGSKYEVVFNVVDTDLFKPGIKSNNGNKFTFLHVSTTHDEQKNISGMLQAVKAFSEQNSNFELNIISESDFSIHEKTAERLGILNKYVFFKNAKQAKGIAEEMKKSDCFLLFSNYENLPVVILEAMACGLPVISSTAGGVPEHITSEYGLLVPPGDSVALTQAMGSMINNRKKYDSDKIRSYALKHFSYEEVGKRFHEVYKKVI